MVLRSLIRMFFKLSWPGTMSNVHGHYVLLFNIYRLPANGYLLKSRSSLNQQRQKVKHNLKFKSGAGPI